MNILTIAQYSTRAQHLLFETLLDHPRACTHEIPTLSSYKCINSLLAHMVGAEQRWLAHLEDQPRPLRYEDNAPADTGLIHRDWKTHRDRTLSLIEDEQHPGMRRVYDVVLPHWNNFGTKMSKIEILFHIFNHENYHRGQCSWLLQMQGIDPPNFDYPFLRPDQ